MKYFYTIRLKVYGKRKAFLIKDEQVKISKTSEKLRFL